LTVVAAAVAGGCIGSDDPGEPGEPGKPVEPKVPDEPKVAIAEIEQLLPVDGCDMRVTINDARYAPDSASRELIVAQKLPSIAHVAIKYHLTGDTGVVECGWYTHQTLPEIAFEFVDTE
jgi:hypothetical protein